LKQKWGTMQQVLSSQSRLKKIVDDIVFDMNLKPRLMDFHGNAILVAGSIYEACQYYDLFDSTELKGKCAVVTSYSPNIADIKGETTGEGETDALGKYKIYKRMLADWFNEDPETAINKAELFEKEVKKKFIDEPGQMRLLIVVDKLLTGFDAPSATYLYIDKQMRDHGLFQAICRVNRLDGDTKDYGYIVDYKDLFKSLEGAVQDYTSGALDAYEQEDVEGLLKDRLKEARKDLEDAREKVKALCEPVAKPYDTLAYQKVFLGVENEARRLKLYQFVSALIRTYGNLANELAEAGYTASEIATLQTEVDHYSKVRDEIKIAAGDNIDLKAYEPAMRHLIDTYIRAEESEKISAFNDLSLIQLIVERGTEVIDSLPKGIGDNEEASAEAIENNVRKLIINESPIDPAYYDKISALLDALIEQRRKKSIDYKDYLDQIVQLTRQAAQPGGTSGGYPPSLISAAQRALFNNLGRNESLALAIHEAVLASRQNGFRGNVMKLKKIRIAIQSVLANFAANSGFIPDVFKEPGEDEYKLTTTVSRVLDLVTNQDEY